MFIVGVVSSEVSDSFIVPSVQFSVCLSDCLTYAIQVTRSPSHMKHNSCSSCDKIHVSCFLFCLLFTSVIFKCNKYVKYSAVT